MFKELIESMSRELKEIMRTVSLHINHNNKELGGIKKKKKSLWDAWLAQLVEHMTLGPSGL